MSRYPKVKIIRALEREGLIKARLRGAAAAKAPTLTFLDSHVECTKGWLEPLLDRIALDPTNVASPVIERIIDETFEYVPHKDLKKLLIGGFDWTLIYKWHKIPESERARRKDISEPVRTPTSKPKASSAFN